MAAIARSEAAYAQSVEQHEVTFEGSPAFARALVQSIREAGGEVEWEPPHETRSGAIELVIIPLLVTLSYDLLKGAVQKFLAVRRSKVKIDGEDIDPGATRLHDA